MKIDTVNRKPHFNNLVAGLSGPAIRPLAVRVVYQVCSRVNIPVIGMGGISTLDDMLEVLSLIFQNDIACTGLQNFIAFGFHTAGRDDRNQGNVSAGVIDDIKRLTG